jgi:hypothetical protein
MSQHDCLQDVNSLQYEAEQLATKAATEKAEVMGELERLHKLVASFQAQIREVSPGQCLALLLLLLASANALQCAVVLPCCAMPWHMC